MKKTALKAIILGSLVSCITSAPSLQAATLFTGGSVGSTFNPYDSLTADLGGGFEVNFFDAGGSFDRGLNSLTSSSFAHTSWIRANDSIVLSDAMLSNRVTTTAPNGQYAFKLVNAVNDARWVIATVTGSNTFTVDKVVVEGIGENLSAASANAVTASSVPEPSLGILTSLGSMVALLRRRRSH